MKHVRVLTSEGNHTCFQPAKRGQLAPLPVAVHVYESDLAQPAQLDLKIEQLVRGIFVRPAYDFQEFLVDAPRWRCHVLQITESATRSDDLENLLIERVL